MEKRVSTRLRNKPGFGHNKKRSSNGSNGNHSGEKKTKLINLSMREQALVSTNGSSMHVTCSSKGDVVANSTSNGALIFQDRDFRLIKNLREVLRLYNIPYKLKPQKEKQSRSKKRKNKKPEPEDKITKAMFHKYCVENVIPGLTTSTYLLRLLRGMAKFGADKVHFIHRELPRSLSLEYPWMVCRDLSYGQEDISIFVTNVYDDPPVAPTGFTYIKSMQVSNNVIVLPSADGCKYKGSCTNEETCSCASLNGSEFPYILRNGGRLIEARDIVFECGPTCGCRHNCANRISQKGLKYQLEVYRTPKKGWAVRTSDFIPSGAPIIEYVGVLSRSDELENVASNNYIFDTDCLQTINEVEGRERRLRNVSLPTNPSVEPKDDEIMESGLEFCIDASSFGNVARFINHSCGPNLFVQCVMSPHLNIKRARVALFAAENIKPYQELTYDYGYQLDSVSGPNGKIKQLPCYCGATTCRKRLY